MSYLLDTNILSELRRGRQGDPRVRAWAKATESDRHCISVLSLGEIRKGIEILRRRAPEQCPAFEGWLAKLQADYAAHILPIDGIISERWGHLMAERSLPVIDGLLAATALTYRLTIATRNVNDFRETGVEWVNPFDE